MEILQRVGLFAGAISLIGLPVTARIDSAAPPRPSPVDPCQHDAGEADALVEGTCQVDRVLTVSESATSSTSCDWPWF